MWPSCGSDGRSLCGVLLSLADRMDAVGWTQSLWRGAWRWQEAALACNGVAATSRLPQLPAPRPQTHVTCLTPLGSHYRYSQSRTSQYQRPHTPVTHQSLHRTPQTTRVTAPAAVASGSGPVPHGGCAPGVRARQRPPASRPRHGHSPAPSPAHATSAALVATGFFRRSLFSVCFDREYRMSPFTISVTVRQSMAFSCLALDCFGSARCL